MNQPNRPYLEMYHHWPPNMQRKSSAPLMAVLFLMASLSGCFGEGDSPMPRQMKKLKRNLNPIAWSLLSILESTYTMIVFA